MQHSQPLFDYKNCMDFVSLKIVIKISIYIFIIIKNKKNYFKNSLLCTFFILINNKLKQIVIFNNIEFFHNKNTLLYCITIIK